MKPFLPLMLVVAAVAMAWVMLGSEGPHREAAAKTPTPRALGREPAEGEVVRVFEVEGMCCVGCSQKLHTALAAVAGVNAAAVDFETGTATALADSNVDLADLQAALEFDKYSAKAQP